MDLEYPDSHDLNFSNRPVRTRMPGGVAGAQSMMTAPYADSEPEKLSSFLEKIELIGRFI